MNTEQDDYDLQHDSPIEDGFSEDIRRAGEPTTSGYDPSFSEAARQAYAKAAMPERIGRYHVKRVIASGGMGIVYEATQDRPRRTVALKVMKQGIASRSALRRFEYEAQLLARLRHPGVAQVFDAGTHRDEKGTVPFFAMEYIPNAKALTHYAQEKGLSTRRRLELFAQVCDAVHHGHQKGIIHRDLKPSNILVDSSGQVKIIDFGVARCTDSDMAVTTLQTDVGQLIGTLQYMSPEQCAADPHDIDIRSDVYALGVVLFELLTDEMPYDVTNRALHEATRVVREVHPARLSAIKGSIRGDVETITLKALEKERERRYQSAADLGQDIQRFLAGEAITARPSTLSYHLRVLVRRNKPFFGAIAVAFVILIGATIFSTNMYYRADDERQRTVEALVVADQQRIYAETSQVAAVRERDNAVIAEGEAEERSAESKEVLNFFIDMLSSAKPDQLGIDVTVREVLDNASETIGVKFPDQPLQQAEVRHAMAETYFALGLFEKGLRHAEKSAEIYQESKGRHYDEMLRSMNSQAIALDSLGRLTEALAVNRKILDRRRRALGDSDLQTLGAKMNLGRTLMALGEFTEAETLQMEAAEGFTKLEGREGEHTLSASNNLAEALFGLGRLEEAENIFRETLEIRSRPPNEEHTDTLFTANGLALALQGLGKFPEAGELFRDTLAARRRKLGDAHQDTWKSMINLARLLLVWEPEDQRKPDEAFDLLRDANELSDGKFPLCFDVLALAYYVTGDKSKALETQQKAVDLLLSGPSALHIELEAHLAKYEAELKKAQP